MTLLKTPDYAQKKGVNFRIMQLTPDEYIDIAAIDAKKQGFSRDELVNQRLKNRDTIDKLKKTKNIFMPVLGFHDGFYQEGLHRALAAKENKEKKIPVFVSWRKESDLPKQLRKKL
jgi:hypothetical protein